MYQLAKDSRRVHILQNVSHTIFVNSVVVVRTRDLI